MHRPFFFAGIERLEALVADPSTSGSCLEAIRSELSFRHTWRARKLAQQLQCDNPAHVPKPQAPSAPSSTLRGAANIKVSTVPLSTRARNVLAALGVTVVGDLCRLSEAKLLRTRNAGRKTVDELRAVLRSLGLNFGTDISTLGSGPTQIALPMELRVDEPHDLAGALKAHVSAVTRSERNLRWVIEHFGWDGRPHRTLETIGSADNVSRERVRQVAAQCSRRLSEREDVPRALEAALRVIDRNAPLSQSSLNKALDQHGLAQAGFHIDGIRTAASVFGLEFPYSVLEGNDPLIIQRQFATLPSGILRSAKTEVAAHGAIVDDQLVEICRSFAGSSVALEFVHSILRAERTFVQLPGCDNWWWRPALAARGRNRLVNTISKVLAACPAIRLTELRDACRRHVRSNHIAPPTRVMQAICSSLPFVNLRSDMVERIPSAVNWDEVLNPSEQLLLKIFEGQTPVLDSYRVSQAGIALGLNENSLSVYKTYSPILWSPVPGYYSVVGSQIPVGLIDDLRCRRGRIGDSTIEFGWTADHKLVLARQINEGIWLSGIVGVPSAVQRFIQGDFSLYALSTHRLGEISVKEASAFGLKSFMRMFGADLGDMLVVAFNPREKRCDCWLGGNELRELTHLGPDAILSHLSGTHTSEMDE